VDPQSAHAQNYSLLYRFFYYRDVDAGDIEDLCQETFYRFFSKYDCSQLDSLRITKTLYAIARNVWREWLRSEVASRTVELDDDDGAYGADFNAFTEEEPSLEMDDVQRGMLIKAIKTLNPTLRTVLTMRFLEGKTRSAIAEHLGTKEKYVHIYQQRGIKALQKALALSAVSPLAHT
jgi:RNA polymerase sigma factor (sigma-70 family)